MNVLKNLRIEKVLVKRHSRTVGYTKKIKYLNCKMILIILACMVRIFLLRENNL